MNTKKTTTTMLAVASLGIITANAAIVQGDFSDGATSVATAANNILRFPLIDSGWSGNGTTGWSGNVGEYAQTGTTSNSLGQAFTNTQTGSGTISFDWDGLTGTGTQLNITYTVYGWGTPTVSPPTGTDERLFRLNNTTTSFDMPGAPAATLVSGTVSDVSGGGATTFTSADFDVSGYTYIGVHFLQRGTLAARTLDNVTLSHAPVPEPSSAALLGLGGLALILRRRK